MPKYHEIPKKLLGAASGAALGFISGNTLGAIKGARIGWDPSWKTIKEELGIEKFNKLYQTLSKLRRMYITKKERRRIRRKAQDRSGKRKFLPKPAVPVLRLRGGAGHRIRRRNITRNYNTAMQGISQHNDMSSTFFKANVGKNHKVKSLGRYVYNASYSFIASSVEGCQVVDTLNAFGTLQQLGGATSAVRASKTAWAVSPFELNPYSTFTGSAYITSGRAANDMFYLDNISGTLKVTNITTGHQDIEIYWCLSRRDQFNNPYDAWAMGMSDDALGHAVAQQQAVTTGPNAQVGAGTLQAIGSKPGYNKAFKKNWKVLKRMSFVLQAGDTRAISYVFKYNKLIRKTMLNNMQASTVFLAGFSVVPMFIVKGPQVGVVDGAAGALVTEMTYGATRVGFLNEYRVNFKAVPTNRISTQVYFPGITGAYTVAVGHPENIINDVDQPAVLQYEHN